MLFKIGDFSRLCRVTVRTLRYYDEIGLLKPVQVDRFNGYRYYSFEQLMKLNRIVMLKGIGLSLDDIGNLLDNNTPPDHIRQLLQVKKSEIQKRIRQDTSSLRQVDVWLNRINKEGGMPEEVYVQRKTLPPIRILSKRELGTYDETIVRLHDELDLEMAREENRSVFKKEGPVMGVFHDDEYKETDADIEIGIPVSGDISTKDTGFTISILPGCDVISAVHEGPAYTVEQAYVRIMEYAEEHNLELIPPVRELYLISQDDIPEEDWLLEVQYPYRIADR